MLICVLLVLRFKAFLLIGSHYLGGVDRDAGLYVWLLQSNLRDLFSEGWFSSKAFFPYGRTLAWSDNFILPALATKPLHWAGVPPILLYNSVLLAASLLNGYCTYLFGYRLSGAAIPAFISGSAFMCLAALGGHLGHPQLQFAFWLPLVLLALFRFLARPSFAAAVPIGLCVSGAFLASVYYAVLLPLAVISITAAFLLLRPRRYRSYQYGQLVTGSLVGLLPLIPFVLPYIEVRRALGPRQLYEASAFAATAAAYFSAPVLNLLYGATSSFSHSEAHLFPGFVVLIFAAIGYRRLVETRRLRMASRLFLLFLGCTCVFSLKADSSLVRTAAAAAAWAALAAAGFLVYSIGRLERRLDFSIMTNRGLIAALLFSGLFFFLLSLGPLGGASRHDYPLGVFRVLYAVYPGANGLRATGRIGIFALFFLIAVLPFALRLIRGKMKLGSGFMGAVLFLIILENWQTAYPVEAPVDPPGVFAQLANRTRRDPSGAALVLPLVSQRNKNGTVASWADFANLNVRYLLWTFPSGLPLINGYSGQHRTMRSYPGKLAGFPDTRSINWLGSIPGLRYIIYLPAYNPNFNQLRFQEGLTKFSDSLELLGQDAQGGCLLRFKAPEQWVTEALRSPLTKQLEGFHLWAPAAEQTLLELELAAGAKKGAPAVYFEAYAADAEGRDPFATLQLTADGSYHRHTIALPDVYPRVKPIQVHFKIRPYSKVKLRERRVIRQH